MIKINATDAIRLLDIVVAEAPEDFVYPKLEFPGAGTTVVQSEACQYQYQGAPSCGVGKALFKAGVSLDQLKGMDGTKLDTDIYSLWTQDLLPGGLTLTEGAMSVFDTFQRHQDKRTGPWSESLDHARMRYALIAEDPKEQ